MSNWIYDFAMVSLSFSSNLLHFRPVSFNFYRPMTVHASMRERECRILVIFWEKTYFLKNPVHLLCFLLILMNEVFYIENIKFYHYIISCFFLSFDLIFNYHYVIILVYVGSRLNA